MAKKSGKQIILQLFESCPPYIDVNIDGVVVYSIPTNKELSTDDALKMVKGIAGAFGIKVVEMGGEDDL